VKLDGLRTVLRIKSNAIAKNIANDKPTNDSPTIGDVPKTLLDIRQEIPNPATPRTGAKYAGEILDNIQFGSVWGNIFSDI
jgi:hypothetical protein